MWEEYRQAHPDGYGYSHFCELYKRWRDKQDVVLRQEHKAGEKMFVDWAGATISVHDPMTGQVWAASLFVAVLGASSYTYVEATRDQQLANWIQAHVRALEFFGGVPELAVPDNTKTGVTRACRYDPEAMLKQPMIGPQRPSHRDAWGVNAQKAVFQAGRLRSNGQKVTSQPQ